MLLFYSPKREIDFFRPSSSYNVFQRLQNIVPMHSRRCIEFILLCFRIFLCISTQIRSDVSLKWKMHLSGLGCSSLTSRVLMSCARFVYALQTPWPMVLVVSVVAYFVEAFMSTELKYLRNVRSNESVRRLIERMHRAEPRITWHVKCYHYEERITYTTGAFCALSSQLLRI